MIAFMNVEEDAKGGMNLTKIIVYLVMYIHIFACTWWFLIKVDKKWVYGGFVSTNDPY
jgi:hypothetical protein